MKLIAMPARAIHKKLQEAIPATDGIEPSIEITPFAVALGLPVEAVTHHLNTLASLDFVKISGGSISLTATGRMAKVVLDDI